MKMPFVLTLKGQIGANQANREMTEKNPTYAEVQRCENNVE